MVENVKGDGEILPLPRSDLLKFQIELTENEKRNRKKLVKLKSGEKRSLSSQKLILFFDWMNVLKWNGDKAELISIEIWDWKFVTWDLEEMWSKLSWLISLERSSFL